MTPEIKKLQRDIEDLRTQLRAFQNLAQLNPEIIRTISKAVITSGSKGATSENRSVNEAGAASYTVLLPPDRFIKIGDYYLPAYDS